MSSTSPLPHAPAPGGSFAGLLWRHRALLWQFTLRNIHLRHKGSFLGILWSVLNPLLQLGLYVLVFGVIMGGRFEVRPDETGVEYALGVFLGLTVFGLVAEIFGSTPYVLVSHTNLVKKVVFPLEILPAAAVAASTYHFLISLGLCFVGLLCYGPPLSLQACWLPVILLPVLGLGLGLAWACAALGVFFRDLPQVTGFLATALFYASAIFFSAQKIPEPAWSILKWNPCLQAVELCRDALLWQIPIQAKPLIFLYACGALSCWLGYGLFRRLKPGFADVL